MSSVNLTANVSKEAQENIFSFLSSEDLKSAACACKAFKNLSENPNVWRQKTEGEFDKLIVSDAKTMGSSWKEVYDKLERSQKQRVSNTEKVLQAHRKKIQNEDLRQRTQRAAAALFGLPTPSPDTHYHPTGQVGRLGQFKVTVLKSSKPIDNTP